MPDSIPQPQEPARERLAHALAHGGPHLGDLVWPEVRLGDVLLERADLTAWLLEEALPADWAPPEPSGQKAFGRALSQARNLDAAPNVSIERETLRSRVALVRHHVGSGLVKLTSTWARVLVDDFDELHVEWSTDADVVAARDGTMTSTVYVHVEAALTVLRQEYERHLRYTDAQELGSMVTTVVQHHLGGMRVRRDGGLYYVPTSSSDDLRRFARVVAKIGDSRLPFIPTFDSEEGRVNLGRSVSDTLHAEVRGVLDGLKKLGTDTKGPRESSLQRRLDELDGLSARASTARMLLADYSDGIQKAVGRAKKAVLELMELGDE